MGSIKEKAKKLKLSAANFLKIVPERVKKIANAGTEEIRSADEYKANVISRMIHPGVQKVRVADIKTLGDGSVKLFRLTPDRDNETYNLAPFKAGSCVSVTVVIDGKKYRRPYSISSSPLDGFYEIIVKKTSGGTVSSFLHEKVLPGDKLDVSEPFGEFTYNRLRDARTVVGIAGGIGITPFRSFVKAIKDGAENFRLILLYGAGNEGELILREELECGSPDIKVVYVLSDVPFESRKEGFEYGFIDAKLIEKYAPEDSAYSIFACGPAAMYDFLDGETERLDVRKKYVRFDFRGEPRKGHDAPNLPESFSVTVRKGGDVSVIDCGRDETVLRALERAGIACPSRCRSGSCGFCHSRLISGEYYMPEKNDGRRIADRTYGYIDPCCTFPLSDLEIEIPADRE